MVKGDCSAVKNWIQNNRCCVYIYIYIYRYTHTQKVILWYEIHYTGFIMEFYTDYLIVQIASGLSLLAEKEKNILNLAVCAFLIVENIQ